MKTHIDRRVLASERNATTTRYPADQPLHRLFEAVARKAPEAPAVTDGSTTLTYGQLDRIANATAHRLWHNGIEPGDRVGVQISTTTDAIAAMLAVFKAGGVYVPLDLTYPDNRLDQMCRQVGVRALVADPEAACRLPLLRIPWGPDYRGTGPAAPPAADRTATDAAYIMFTSGTTGRPKAVSVPHRAPSRLVVGNPQLETHAGDTWLACASMTFDVSLFEIFGALLNGARLVLLDTDTMLSPDAFAHRIEAEQADVLVLSAGVLHELVAWRPGMFARLRYLVSTADALNPTAARSILRHGRPQRFINAYGPTENGIFCTMQEITEIGDHDNAVPIGRPAANSVAHIVLPDGREADIGEDGELWVGGSGLAFGYDGDPARTRERFVTGPFPSANGERLYRTGDRARWREDGAIDFLGRADRQVKVSGYRVELTEVESMLTTHPDVADAVADVRESRDGRRHIEAWTVRSRRTRNEDGDLDFGRRLRAHIGDRLPRFMVPASVHVVDELPLNRNGKVDRGRLSTTREPGSGRAPEGTNERLVAETWESLLASPSFGRDDDFFERGGQSLHVVHAVASLQHKLEIPAEDTPQLVRAMLGTGTVRGFARVLDEILTGDNQPEEIDFDAEAGQELDLDFRSPLAARSGEPREILLTGATGFFGSFLLDRLLGSTEATVHCLVRASDEEHARTRIRAALDRFGLRARFPERVVPVVGDLASPGFGLTGARFDQLARRVDSVIHSGAQVNFLYPYSALRAANVDAVRTILRLATTHHLKPVHHLSTIDILAGRDHLTEDQLPERPERLSTGYPQTKWVAESLLRRAAAEGLPVSVYRPSEISGSTDSGAWNTDTLVCALVKTIADTGIAPDVDLPLDLVPADYAADALLYLATRLPAGLETYHLTNARPADLSLVIDRLRARGHEIRTLPYRQWMAETTRHSKTDPACPLAPYLPLFTGGSTSMIQAGLTETFPRYGRRKTAAALADSGLHCPSVDAALIDHYLDYFHRIGFLT
ncbi:amino acid adenylation domain-containing protein [Amycolatopsis alba]|uniref:Peptide synthetase n=1 Tax=Amycolatopsis alba DSM 44262 TaxID=1125972 RepID=A0A229RSV9_AMYAL|nr:amino acid adenylation domain-containing protein [Amycolatopsis alba]OXM49748.1 peptide synthetase [Amycolatopsis alba DSM 44262]